MQKKRWLLFKNKQKTQRRNAQPLTNSEERQEELARLRTQVEERERALPLRERIKEIFKKYGVTVASIFVAAGVMIGAIIGAIANALKATGKALGNGLKDLGQKTASLLPARIDCCFPLQSCWSGHRFSGRAHLAIDFGCCGLSDGDLYQKAALTE